MQHAQVFRHRWLFEPKRNHDVTDSSLFLRQVNQDLPAPRLRHRIEGIGSCRRSCHEGNYIFLYRNMSSGDASLRAGPLRIQDELRSRVTPPSADSADSGVTSPSSGGELQSSIYN